LCASRPLLRLTGLQKMRHPCILFSDDGLGCAKRVVRMTWAPFSGFFHPKKCASQLGEIFPYKSSSQELGDRIHVCIKRFKNFNSLQKFKIKIKIKKLIAFDDLRNGTTLRTISYDIEVII
jgi:hypothetical protein